jgi:hypothetical protein
LSAVCLTALLALAPASATAQKDPFIDAFIRFHSLLSGTYGDEGPQAAAALDRIAAALAAWEAANRKGQAELMSGPTGAPSNRALFFLEAGRFDDALGAIEAAIRIETAARGPSHVPGPR